LKPSIYIGRRGLNIRSGAGQMIASQARFFSRRDYAVTVCCNSLSRGSLDPFGHVKVIRSSRLWRLLVSRSRRRQAMVESIRELRAIDRGILIDHEPCIASAEISYVHNFLAPEHANRIDGYMTRQQDLASVWENAPARNLIITNSGMVKQGLMHQFGLPDKRIEVIYPGYDPARFNLGVRSQYRENTRRRLGVDRNVPLIGLVMSGDPHKRGLDRFLNCVERLKTAEPTLRALVLGARRCPDELKNHPLYRTGDIIFKHSTFVPEQYFAALDILLLPARYEEFGIVALEGMAMGVPIVTSSAVGASEILPDVSTQYVIDAADDTVDEFSRRANQLLQLDSAGRAELGQALSYEAGRYTHEAHNDQLAGWVDSFADLNTI